MTEKKLKKKNNPHELREEFPIEEKKEEEKEEEKDWEEEIKNYIKYIKTEIIVPITKIEILSLFSQKESAFMYYTLDKISERISPLASGVFKQIVIKEALEDLVEEGMLEKTGEEQPAAFYSLKESEKKIEFIIEMIAGKKTEELKKGIEETIKEDFLRPCVRLEILNLCFLEEKNLMEEPYEKIAEKIKRDKTTTEKTEVEYVLEELAKKGIIEKTVSKRPFEEDKKYYSSLSGKGKRIQLIKKLIEELIIKYIREEEEKKERHLSKKIIKTKTILR